MTLARNLGLTLALLSLVAFYDFVNLQKKLNAVLSLFNLGFIVMLVFMVTKDDYDRYGIWKTFIGNKQPSITEMLEFGKWAVFKPMGILMQATIIDFNNDDDALESSESIEIASQYASTSASLIRPASKTPAPHSSIPAAPPPPPLPVKVVNTPSSDEDLKCKKVSWKELKIDMKNTIWDRVNRHLANGEVKIDKEEIMELFREKPRKAKKFSAKSPGSASTDESKTLTGKKQLNISIALAHHQVYADELIKAVTNVDVRLLEADFLSTIESFLPDQKEESALVQKYSKKSLDTKGQILTDPEEFSFLLSSIPQFRKRIRAMVFQCSFYDRVNAICKNFEVVRQSIEEIRRSQRLEKILMYILSTGKTMNNTSTKAFNIDFLPTASRCKTSDGDSNFLAYVTSKIESRDPQILNLSEELPSLAKAVKVSLIDVDRDCTELAVEYSSIAMELEAIAADSDGLKDFLQQGRLDLNNIKRKRRQMQQELNDLAQYFGMDPLKTKPTELFGIFKQFQADLANAMETAARKLQKIRSMNRSVSAPSFRRSSRNCSFPNSRNSSARSSRNSSFRRSRRSYSINSNYSDVSGDTSFTDDSMIINDPDTPTSRRKFDPEHSPIPRKTSVSRKVEIEDSPMWQKMEVSREIDIGERQSPVSMEMSGENSVTSSSSNSPQIGSTRRKDEFIEEDGRGRPKTRMRRSLSEPSERMSSEDVDFTSKKEMLRKVLLSPVREKTERSIRVAEDVKRLRNGLKKKRGAEKKRNVENDMADEIKRITDKSNEFKAGEIKAGVFKADENKVGEIKADELEAGEFKVGEIKVDEIKAEKFKADKIKADQFKADEINAGEFKVGEFKANEIKANEIKANETKRKELNLSKETVKIEENIIEKEKLELKGKTDGLTNGEVRNESVATKLHLLNKDRPNSKTNSMKSTNLKNKSIVNSQKHKEDPSPLFRSSSLRRSNRKITKVSIKSIQAKELQKARKMVVSKSESNISSLKSSRRRTKSEGFQSVILKPGFIEELSPMKCEIKDINNNNHDLKTKSTDDNRLSRTLERKQSKGEEEITLRRTKSAIISRNKQRASLVIFV